MHLLIDNREPKKNIDYLNYLNSNNNYIIKIVTLEIGDYIIYDEINDKNVIIIERKSLADLESSIKDGRYDNQSYRLNQIDIHNHNIYYLIEGSIINYRNSNFKNTLYSSLLSLSYYKGFSILNSLNNIETCELVYSFFCKIIKEKKREPYYNNFLNNNNTILDLCNNLINNNDSNDSNDINYLNTLKVSKKSNIDINNIENIMLMQIPNVNVASSEAIINKYKTVKNLILELEKDETCLNNIRLNNNRKINKNTITSIIMFLLKNKN